MSCSQDKKVWTNVLAFLIYHTFSDAYDAFLVVLQLLRHAHGTFFRHIRHPQCCLATGKNFKKWSWVGNFAAPNDEGGVGGFDVIFWKLPMNFHFQLKFYNYIIAIEGGQPVWFGYFFLVGSLEALCIKNFEFPNWPKEPAKLYFILLALVGFLFWVFYICIHFVYLPFGCSLVCFFFWGDFAYLYISFFGCQLVAKDWSFIKYIYYGIFMHLYISVFILYHIILYQFKKYIILYQTIHHIISKGT